MSVQAITWALDQTCATATEKAILLVLANYVGADGTCYPGQDTIATQACCSLKSVERALAAFEDRGWIERHARRRRDGSRTSDLIDFVATSAPDRVGKPQPDSVSGSEPTRLPVRTNPTPCPNQPDSVSGLTTFEPLGEPLGEAAAVAQALATTPEPVVQLVATVVESPEPTPANDWPEGDARRHAELLVELAATVRLDVARQPGLTLTAGRLAAWRRDGASWEHDVVPVVTSLARKRGQAIASWKFFDAAVAQSIADNRQALNIPEARHAAQTDDRVSDRQSSRRANRDRSDAGAEWASQVVAARGGF
ncbi:helix-turn-helix domain-containing protein [Brevundimonas diminuta]|uniref:helix-turn-helix domain-containing protein n=1 Tax=Brevundimonas diminuta TaxID=293 RepID=UPI0037C7A690